eukprot:1960633-Prymnesium_polylepis.1
MGVTGPWAWAQQNKSTLPRTAVKPYRHTVKRTRAPACGGESARPPRRAAATPDEAERHAVPCGVPGSQVHGHGSRARDGDERRRT